MGKTIWISALMAGVLSTSSANFAFTNMFKEIKATATSINKDMKDSMNSLKDGVLETSKSAERTISNISSDLKESSVNISDDLKTSEITNSKAFTEVSKALLDTSKILVKNISDNVKKPN